MKSRHHIFKTGTLALLFLTGASWMTVNEAVAAETVPPSTSTAVPIRPAADKARDADRKPVEMLEFAKVMPGQTVVDYLPGKGYFTRLFSTAVGSQGVVYAVMPQVVVDKFKTLPPPVSAEPGYGNVREIVAPGGTLNVPSKADLIWTSQNYHDIHIWLGTKGIVELNKAAFDSLKPGGFFVILDHAGLPGLDDAGMAKLHRIDEAQVKKEVLAAGFVLDGESQALRNPDDPHTSNVFNPDIRGKTDQFILRFRKP